MRTILVDVEDSTYEQLQNEKRRIRGSLRQTKDKGKDRYVFYEYGQGEGLPRTETIHRMDHGRVRLSERRMSVLISINLRKELRPLTTLGEQNREALDWLNDNWFNYNFDMPYGVRN